MLRETLFALDGHMDIVKSRGSIIPEEGEECEEDQQEQQSAQQYSERNVNDMVYMQGAD
jgi:hypothetical protein